MKRIIVALSMLLLVGAGCTLTPSAPPQVNTPPEKISVSIDGNWELKTYAAAGKSAEDVSKLGATLTVEAGAQLSARICNSMSGTYDLKAGVLKVDGLMSTKMFCEGAAGEIEAAFSEGLSSGMTTELNGNTLVLRSTAGAAFSYERATENGRVGEPSAEEPSEDRTYAGVITSVDLVQMAVDGPAVIVLRTAAGAEAKILVPSMGLNFCKAKASIADVAELKVGNNVEARGSVGVEGAIVPCQSEAHYLRVVKK